MTLEQTFPVKLQTMAFSSTKPYFRLFLDACYHLSPVEIAFTLKKFIIFGVGIWHDDSGPCPEPPKKNPHVLDVGLPPFSAFKVCHLVSKSFYYPTANPKIVKVPSFE